MQKRHSPSSQPRRWKWVLLTVGSCLLLSNHTVMSQGTTAFTWASSEWGELTTDEKMSVVIGTRLLAAAALEVLVSTENRAPEERLSILYMLFSIAWFKQEDYGAAFDNIDGPFAASLPKVISKVSGLSSSRSVWAWVNYSLRPLLKGKD